MPTLEVIPITRPITRSFQKSKHGNDQPLFASPHFHLYSRTQAQHNKFSLRPRKTHLDPQPKLAFLGIKSPIVRSTVPCIVHRRLNRNAICLFPTPGPSRIPGPSLPSRGSLAPERGNLRGFGFRTNGFRDWEFLTALAASSGTALL